MDHIMEGLISFKILKIDGIQTNCAFLEERYFPVEIILYRSGKPR
jgi:hypothetical protein